MSTLIPSISTCKFDTPGERRFARLLEAKLEDDYLCWGKTRDTHRISIKVGNSGTSILNSKNKEKSAPDMRT